MEEIINKIFKEKYPNGLSAEYTKEEMVGYMMAINDIKEQLTLNNVSQQRELLIDCVSFCDGLDLIENSTVEEQVDSYLLSINCG